MGHGLRPHAHHRHAGQQHGLTVAAALDTGKVTVATLSILGSPFQKLTLGMHDTDDGTTSVAPTGDDGKVFVAPVPLAVWVGPVREAEPIRAVVDRRGELVARHEAAIANADSAFRTAAAEPSRFVAANGDSHITPMIEFDLWGSDSHS